MLGRVIAMGHSMTATRTWAFDHVKTSHLPEQRLEPLTPPSLRVHDLRHTAASLMIASGDVGEGRAAALGHRSATLTLDRYGHLWPDELDTLADALERLRRDAPGDSRGLSGVADVIALESRR